MKLPLQLIIVWGLIDIVLGSGFTFLLLLFIYSPQQIIAIILKEKNIEIPSQSRFQFNQPLLFDTNISVCITC